MNAELNHVVLGFLAHVLARIFNLMFDIPTFQRP